MGIPWNSDSLKPQGDHLVVATAWDSKVRLAAVRTTETVSEALRIHEMSPASTIALGRFLSGALLLGSDIKNEGQSMTLQIRSSGPVKGMTVVAESDGTVRGDIMEPLAQIPVVEGQKPELKQAVGTGQLTVVKDLGMREPYVGTVELLSGEIAEDLAYYLMVSEQVRSVVALGVRIHREGVKQAGGLIVQLMPGAGPEVEDYIEARAGGFPDISYWLEEGFTPAQICDLFMGDPGIEYLDVRPVAYKCHCSRERMERNLLALGRGQLASLAEDPNGIDLVCHFCRTEYHFSLEEVRSLWEDAGSQST